jgi:hypothetical protein
MDSKILPVILDANVLYSSNLRDMFMRLTIERVIQGKWTEDIHEEWIRNVLKNRSDITREQLEKVKDLMNRFGLDWQVPEYH